MGIFDALNTSVSGLQAQSFALQNISGNISNASTVGYKGIGTSFEDLVPQSTTPDRQVAGGVTAYAQATITTQGTVSATTVATNMAISGVGFFNVQKPIGIVDNAPVFNGVTDYTRRGDFQLNANGNLVNGAGYYLLGVTVDPKTGNPIGNVPQVLQFQNNFIPAQATTKITYAANLPTKPSTVASSTASAGTLAALGGLNPGDFTPGFNPQIIGTAAHALHRRHRHGHRGQQQGCGPGTHHRCDRFVRRRGHGFADGEFRRRRYHHRRRHGRHIRRQRRSRQPAQRHRQRHDDAGQDRFRSPAPRTPRPLAAARSRCIPVQPRT